MIRDADDKPVWLSIIDDTPKPFTIEDFDIVFRKVREAEEAADERIREQYRAWMESR